jgi:hypothetical protein
VTTAKEGERICLRIPSSPPPRLIRSPKPSRSGNPRTPRWNRATNQRWRRCSGVASARWSTVDSLGAVHDAGNMLAARRDTLGDQYPDTLAVAGLVAILYAPRRRSGAFLERAFIV